MRKPFKFKKISLKMSFNESAFGWDGLSTFIFSNILLLATFGLAFAGLFLRTLTIARNTNTSHLTKKTLLIAGLRLENDQPVDEFKIRLNRVLSLFELIAKEGANKQPLITRADVQIIILGGLTGGNKVSEARSGAYYLIAQGIDAGQIVMEDQSRHTLENLQNARALLLNQFAESVNSDIVSQLSTQLSPQLSPKLSEVNAAIITSRYHLYRVITLASGLGMTLQPIAAEERFNLTFINLLRLFKEAYYLHWYWSGKLWVFITANKKSQARIT